MNEQFSALSFSSIASMMMSISLSVICCCFFIFPSFGSVHWIDPPNTWASSSTCWNLSRNIFLNPFLIAFNPGLESFFYPSLTPLLRMFILPSLSLTGSCLINLAMRLYMASGFGSSILSASLLYLSLSIMTASVIISSTILLLRSFNCSVTAISLR